MISTLRLSFRNLIRSPGFSFATVATLALGIGTTSAIFTLVNQVLLNPPGIASPERVVVLETKYDKLRMNNVPVSVPDFADIRRNNEIFGKVAIIGQADFNYTREDAFAEYMKGAPVSADFFGVFGMTPALGRSFWAEDDQPGTNSVVVLAYSTWKRLFGGDPSIIDKSIQLNQQPYRIIGVAASDFRLPPVDLWVPLGLPPSDFAETNRFEEKYVAFARLNPGVSVAEANAYVKVLSSQFISNGSPGGTYAKNNGWSMLATPMRDFIAGDTKTPLLVLLGAVGFVLLIVCFDVAGLMLARTAGRSREIVVRAALGANRWKLMQPSMVESLLLSFISSAIGLGVSYGFTRLLLLMAPKALARSLDLRIDANVILFSVLVTAMVGAALAFAQGLQIARIAPISSLKGHGHSAASGPARLRLRSTLVVAETAVAVLLLAGAGFFLRSFMHLQELNPGFESRGVWVANLSLAQARYAQPEARAAFYQQTINQLKNLPGISYAALGSTVPFSGIERTGSFHVEGRPLGRNDPEPNANVRYVTGSYFEALGIPVKAGRPFSEQDRKDTEPVAMIDENLAEQFWPNENPVGKRLSRPNQPWCRIIGVVGHVKQADLGSDSGKGTFYFSLLQQPSRFASIVIKSSSNEIDFESTIRKAVAQVDASEAVQDVLPLYGLLSDSLAARRLVTRLLGVFAFGALLIAALGLYGIIAYAVTQRVHEIGIRMALGAQKSSVLQLILGHGIRPAGAGVVIGMAGAMTCTKLLQRQWFGINPFDPVTFIGVGLVMVATALLASYLPARRVLSVNPAEALRYD